MAGGVTSLQFKEDTETLPPQPPLRRQREESGIDKNVLREAGREGGEMKEAKLKSISPTQIRKSRPVQFIHQLTGSEGRRAETDLKSLLQETGSGRQRN